MELSATIPALLAQQAAAYGSETILRKKDRGIWKSVSWSELESRVRDIGQGLRALGLEPGETVAILSETRPEFVCADLAALGCGAASIAVPTDIEAQVLGDILRDARATIALVEGEEQLDKVLFVRDWCPRLRHIVIFDMKGLREFDDPACMGLDALIAAGKGQSDWKAMAASVTPDQKAAILISTAHTGLPVLTDLTHAGILRHVEETGRALDFKPGDERLAVLPMSDPAERILGLYLALKYRIVGNYLENPETATENLREVKPTVLGANAEAWERLHARITAQAEAATGVQKALYNWAIRGRGGPLARWLVLSAVRAHLGFGKLRVAFTGDAPISSEISQWAQALGVTVRHINPFQQGGTHV